MPASLSDSPSVSEKLLQGSGVAFSCNENMVIQQHAARQTQLLSSIDVALEKIRNRLSAGKRNSATLAYLETCYSMLRENIQSLRAGDMDAEYAFSALIAQSIMLSDMLEKTDAIAFQEEELKRQLEQNWMQLINADYYMKEMNFSIDTLSQMQLLNEAVCHDINAINLGATRINAALLIANALLVEDEVGFAEAARDVREAITKAAKQANPEVRQQEIDSAVLDTVMAGRQIEVEVKKDEEAIRTGRASVFANTQNYLHKLKANYIGPHMAHLRQNLNNYAVASRTYLNAKFKGRNAEALDASVGELSKIATATIQELDAVDRIGQMRDVPGLMNYFNTRINTLNDKLGRLNQPLLDSQQAMINEDLEHLNVMKSRYAKILLGDAKDFKETAELLGVQRRSCKRKCMISGHLTIFLKEKGLEK